MAAKWVVLLPLVCAVVSGWHLPGLNPIEYKAGDVVRFKANSITSTKSPIPFDYYSLPVCVPGGKIPKAQVENFGEILWGDVIKPSLYYARMLENVTCKAVCRRKVNPKEAKYLEKKIQDGYRGAFIADSLPVTELFSTKMKGYRSFALGYPLGTPESKAKGGAVSKATVNNHLSFTIKYHKPIDLARVISRGFRIVGFHVAAQSVKHSGDKCSKDFLSLPKVHPDDPEITYSYSITWVEDKALAWSSRWDPYLMNAESEKKIHWFSIMNSVVVVCFLTGMVGYITMRTLHKDFNSYNNKNEEDQEEKGWKLVHADVFRTPPYPQYLAIFVGTGCQLIGMGVITVLFALLGFLSPANRGGLLTAMLLLYILLGSYAGYVSARFFKFFKVENRWANTLLAATFYPGQIFLIFFILDLVLWGNHAANAVPIGTIISLIGLWTCVSTPLVFVGAVLGFKKEDIIPPCATSQVHRPIPEQPHWYLQNPAVNVMLAGILPFGTAFIEVFYIFSAIWLGRYYYVFGFLAIMALILTVTCASITIVMIYFQLCFEDWKWWWRSFFIPGSSGLYLFIYSIYYMVTTLKFKNFISILMYISWMGAMSYTFAIVTGTIGFLSAFMFVKYIYSQIKVA